jgi:hypothetical protein
MLHPKFQAFIPVMENGCRRVFISSFDVEVAASPAV